jgi:hypothetical protein
LTHCRTASRSIVAAALRCAASAAVGDVDGGGDDDVVGDAAAAADADGIVVLPDVVSDVGGDRPDTGDAESDIFL